jgi:general secretion pathway protein H
MQRQRGLTLLELLVVLAIIGFAMAGVSLSLRDSSQTQLEREAQRLVAVLEAARGQSRTSGIPLIWQTTPEGFVIRPAQTPATNGANAPSSVAPRSEVWLAAGTQALASNVVVLGPEPILTPARITLSVSTPNAPTQGVKQLTIGTDGLRPFQVMP